MSQALPKSFGPFLGSFKVSEINDLTHAYNFAKTKHIDQKRLSGIPYIEHPKRVALALLRDGYNVSLAIAGLLHDVIEDTTGTEEEIRGLFGDTVCNIVLGVTKVSKVKLNDKSKIFDDDERFLEQADNYRKIIFALTTNPGAIIVKLYDRLDNIKTVKHLKPEKQKFYARETIEIFAPIAERLGMGKIKTLLEDTAFPYAYPKEYSKFMEEAASIYQNPEKAITKLIPEVKRNLEKEGIRLISISGRTKGQYSLYKKIERRGSLKTVYDIVAMRLIVKTVGECYQALGLVHSLYEPVPNQINDYIAKPKSNGYQSIHTTVKSRSNNVFEVQIRTPEMHELAEYGPLTSHWGYKESAHGSSSKAIQLGWAKELVKLKEINDNGAFLTELKDQLFADQIFVFTPKGDIVRLPKGAVAIDFAYRIHSDLGNHLSGARVNGRLISINTPLQTGDTLELLVNKNNLPKREWLRLAVTSQAKQHIRAFLRKKEEQSLLSRGIRRLQDIYRKFGLKKEVSENDRLKDERLPYKSIKQALIAVGENGLKAVRLAKAINPELVTTEQKKKKIFAPTTAEPKNLVGIRYEYANCCKPKPTDKLVGYIGREHVLKVHRQGCKRLTGVDPKRLIEI
ncbi:MAG: RelA/SpoT family protein [Patescibacteria group bacterium]|jgi:RelA/SpoT family (p)ppGpp synthetase